VKKINSYRGLHKGEATCRECDLHVYRVAQKVSHYGYSSLNRIKTRHYG